VTHGTQHEAVDSRACGDDHHCGGAVKSVSCTH